MKFSVKVYTPFNRLSLLLWVWYTLFMAEIYVITEPLVRRRLWADRYAAGIREEAASCKYKVTELDEAALSCASDCTVIVNAVTKTFCNRILPICESAGVRPLLLAPGPLSVRVDFESVYRQLLDGLAKRGSRRPAFFGVNPDSLNDDVKTATFLDRGGRPDDIFENYGDLKACFETFKYRRAEFDGVLFPNNVTAAVFFRFCEQSGAWTLPCGSLGEVHCRAADVLFSDFDCEEVGRVAVRCARMLDRCPRLTRFLATVPGRVGLCAPATRINQAVPSVPVDYYKDRAVAEAMRYEYFCMAADDADRRIVDMMCKNLPYRKIAATLFMSEQTVKYRVGRLLRLTGYENAEQLKSDYLLYNGVPFSGE